MIVIILVFDKHLTYFLEVIEVGELRILELSAILQKFSPPTFLLFVKLCVGWLIASIAIFVFLLLDCPYFYFQIFLNDILV